MNTADIAQLIKIVKAFAPKTMFDTGAGSDEMAIFTYRAMLGGLPYQDCEDAVLAHYGKGGTDVWVNAGQTRRLVAKRAGLLMPPAAVVWAPVEKWTRMRFDKQEALEFRAFGSSALRGFADRRLEMMPAWLAAIVEPIAAELLDPDIAPQWKRKAFTEAYAVALAEHEDGIGDMSITDRELAVGAGAFSLDRRLHDEYLAITAAPDTALPAAPVREALEA